MVKVFKPKPQLDEDPDDEENTKPAKKLAAKWKGEPSDDEWQPTKATFSPPISAHQLPIRRFSPSALNFDRLTSAYRTQPARSSSEPHSTSAPSPRPSSAQISIPPLNSPSLPPPSSSSEPQKSLVAMLSRAQAMIARWILGAFPASPIGGMEVLTGSGLLPMPLYLRRLFDRSILRFQRLLPNHIIATTATPQALRYHSHSVGFPIHNVLPQSRLSLQSAHQFTRVALEATSHSHLEMQLGIHLLDVFHSLISFNLSHPRKPSDKISEWLHNLRNFISHLSNSPSWFLASQVDQYVQKLQMSLRQPSNSISNVCTWLSRLSLIPRLLHTTRNSSHSEHVSLEVSLPLPPTFTSSQIATSLPTQHSWWNLTRRKPSPSMSQTSYELGSPSCALTLALVPRSRWGRSERANRPTRTQCVRLAATYTPYLCSVASTTNQELGFIRLD